MLSEAKHLCSFARNRSLKNWSDILRFAQNDIYETACSERSSVSLREAKNLLRPAW